MDPPQAAEERLARALADTGARDPRDYYRDRLRELKRDDPAGYEAAVAHYRDVLVPSVASGDADPLEAWLEYGRTLAHLSAPGRTVEVDPTGRAHPHGAPTPRDRMVLHLPDARNRRALIVGLPPNPSAAQRATLDLLTQGKQKLPE